MKKLLPLLLLTVFLASCGSSKKTANTRYKKPQTSIKTTTSSSTVDRVIKHAKKFEGTRYKFGGTTKKGMDCSGLVYTSFLSEDITLPRVSRDMATRGKKITLVKAKAGDLLFFQTNKNRKVINHVGLVVENNRGDLKFIHSTTSKGVIISSIQSNYWSKAFVQARRII